MKKFLLTIPLFLTVLLAGCCKDDDSPIPPTVSIHSDDIAAGELLDLEKTVDFFYYAAGQEITQGTWTLEVLTESGESVTIFTQELSGINFTVTTPASIDEFIPDREDYLRTESGMLNARVRLTGTFASGALASGEYAIELPYRPSTPTLDVCGIEDNFENWISSVTVCFSSLGETNYLIRKLIVSNSSSIFNYGATANENEFTIPYVYMDTKYEIRIKAYNNYGYSKETIIYVGGDDPNYYTNY